MIGRRLMIVDRSLSCCLKLTSFKVFNLDGSKKERGASKHGDTEHCGNFYNGQGRRFDVGAAKRLERVYSPNPQAALDRHGRRRRTAIGATKRMAVPAHRNRNRWSVGDGLTLR